MPRPYHSRFMFLQIFIWWLVIQLLGLVALPLAELLFGALPDRGYAFTKALGLLLTGYGAWLLAMLGLAPFGAPLLVVCAVLVGVVGVLAMRGNVGKSNHGGLPLLRGCWRMILGYEALFLVALVFMALVRSYNPDPWGTERPMDFALFNAIRRSAMFPPHDPWLAGFSINYYYFGYLLMAAVSLLSGLSSEVSFSLSLALIFALTALGVAGVVVNLVNLNDDRRWTMDDRRTPVLRETDKRDEEEHVEAVGQWVTEQEPEPTIATPQLSIVHRPSSIVRLLAPLLAVVLVLLAGNQVSTLQAISGVRMLPALEGNDLRRAIVNGLGAREPLYLEREFKGWDFDGTRVVTPTNMLENFDTWYPSRALWDSVPDPADPAAPPLRRYTITEFPFFSFWLGDMHPHVMALPFALLALALALQTIARADAPGFARGRRGWFALVLTGIVLGSLYTINSWDFPTYLLLFLGALLLLHLRLRQGDKETGRQGDKEIEEVNPVGAFAANLGFSSSPQLHISTLRHLPRWWPQFLAQAALVVAAALLLFLPFHLTFHSLVGSKAPLIDLPLLGRLTRTLGLVTWDKTALHTFLIIFGLFLLPLLAYLGVQAARVQASRWLLWLALATLPVGLLLGFPLLFLLPLALYTIALAVAQVEHPATAFVLWGFALGCLICFGTEIVYLRDVFENRMNTIFKFYYQVWLIWGTLAGYAVWGMFGEQRTKNKEQRTREPENQRTENQSLRFTFYVLHIIRLSSIVIFAVLLAAALIYPWQTAGKALRNDTRIGLAGKTPRQNTPVGAAAIDWLRQNAPSDAVVLEAVGGSYDGPNGTYQGGLGAGGVSASTGLQTVLGWQGHEGQWRAGDPQALDVLGSRQNDVATIYSTTDVAQARALLQQYKVTYIYVGAAERATYPPEGLAKLSQLGSVVFSEGDVVIYAVAK